MTGTDLEAPEQGGELEALSEIEARAGAQQKEELADRKTVLPVLKLLQPLSAEVASGDHPAGTFVNALTGENYGDAVDLIVVRSYLGRLYAPQGEEKVWVAFGDTAPDNWPEQYAGQAFLDIPDAEERYKERANAKEIEWGKGPPIQTTYNYVGVVASALDVPVRFSLKRTSVPAARKLDTFLRAARVSWDNLYNITTTLEQNSSKQKFYVAQVQRDRRSDPAERQAAIRLWETIESSTVVFAGDDADAKAEERAKPATPASALPVD